jgi:hypothetical protein
MQTNLVGDGMDYASYYRKFQADCERFGEDGFFAEGEEENPGSIWVRFTDQEMIDMAVGGAGVRGVGDELARRGLLDKVPGNNWGE